MTRLLIAAATIALLAGTAAAAPRILISLNRQDPFQEMLGESTKAAVEAAGAEASVVFSGNDEARQVAQVKEALDAGTDAIIITSQTNQVSEAVQAMALGPGAPVIFMNVMPTIDHFNPKVSNVVSNDLVAGRLQMRYLGKLMEKTGRLAILVGDPEHPAGIGRTKGVKEVLAGLPGITLVAEGAAYWQRDKARAMVAGWLASGTVPTAIAANNDEMALGAAEAVEAAGLGGRVKIAGVDATPAAIRALDEKRIAFTILQNAKEQGRQSAANALALLEGKPVQLYQWVPYELVTPKTVDAYR